MKVLVLGSCVTRDSFELPSAGGVELHDYVARSSVASAMSQRRVDGVDVDALDSRFQRRIVGRDLDKSFGEIVARDGWDLLLHDAIDERFDLLVGPHGELATRSNELVATGWEPDGFRRVPSGSDEHFALWERGWERLIRMLDARRRRADLRVNRVFWAEADERGEVLDGGALVQAQRANHYLERLYTRMAEDLEPSQFYRYTDAEMRSAVTHRWGPSPFHYVPAFYECTMRLLGAERQRVEARTGAHRTVTVTMPAPAADLASGGDETPADDRVFLFRGRHIVYTVHARPSSRRLVFVFSGFDATPGTTRMSFFGLGKVLDATVVHIKDGNGTHGCYLLSVSGDEQIRNGVITLIRQMQTEFDCPQDRTWFIGTSKGGTCAIAYGLMTGGGRVISGEPQIAIGHFLFGDEPQPEWARAIAYAMLGRVDPADRVRLDDLVPAIVRRYGSRFRGTISLHIGETGYPERHVVPLVAALQEAGRSDCLDVVQHAFATHAEVVPPFVDAVRRELTPYIVAPRQFGEGDQEPT